jgi:hypothetical protein
MVIRGIVSLAEWGMFRVEKAPLKLSQVWAEHGGGVSSHKINYCLANTTI